MKEPRQQHPAAVEGLSLVTLGVYLPFWYYRVNRELRDHGGADVNPGVSVLAVMLGALLVVPLFGSLHATVTRIRHAEATAGAASRTSYAWFWGLTLLGLPLALVGISAAPQFVYLQLRLSRLWALRAS